MWPGYGAHMGWMWLALILALIVLVVLVSGVARATGSSASPRGEDSPEAILKRRYAHGELDREEYDRRLSDLRK